MRLEFYLGMAIGGCCLDVRVLSVDHNSPSRGIDALESTRLVGSIMLRRHDASMPSSRSLHAGVVLCCLD